MPYNEILQEIKYTIALVKSNKLNSFQSKVLMHGILINIILDKEGLLQKNSDIPLFLQDHLFPYLETTESIPEYLYASRPSLSGRINKLLFEELSYTELLNLSEKLEQLILELAGEGQKKRMSNFKNEDIINSWSNIIKDIKSND